METKRVYIVLTKSKTAVSKLIDSVLHSEYTHSSISFDSNLDNIYSFARRYTFLPNPANLKKEYLDKGFYHYYTNTKMGLYSIQVSKESYDLMKEYVENLYKNYKKHKYSFIGMVCCGLKIDLKRKNKMFCSQFVCNVLQHAKENIIDKVPELCVPDDFLSIDGLKCHYIGKVSEVAQLKKNNELEELLAN